MKDVKTRFLELLDGLSLDELLGIAGELDLDLRWELAQSIRGALEETPELEERLPAILARYQKPERALEKLRELADALGTTSWGEDYEAMQALSTATGVLETLCRIAGAENIGDLFPLGIYVTTWARETYDLFESYLGPALGGLPEDTCTELFDNLRDNLKGKLVALLRATAEHLLRRK